MSNNPQKYISSIVRKYLAGEVVVDCFICKYHRRTSADSWLIKCRGPTMKENYFSSEAKSCSYFCPDQEIVMSYHPKVGIERINSEGGGRKTSEPEIPQRLEENMGWAKYQEDIFSRLVQDDQLKGKNQKSTPDLIEKNQKIAPVDNRILPFHSKSEGKQMSKLKEFAMATARPLPVIVLADVSGSMATDGKISALNDALAEMIATFAEEDDSRAEIHVSVVTFGGTNARVHKPLTPADKVRWEAMAATGRTPMGQAFTLARELIENKEIIPSRAYRPTIVLVSDGVPTDDWEQPLKELLTSERASKSMRLAMAIGADADKKTLASFLDDSSGRVFEAHEAREIRKFFRWVTMSVTSRSRSANPNSVVAVEPTDLDDIDF